MLKVKKMPQTYNSTVKNYYAEYDLHVAAWRILGWAHEKDMDKISVLAEKARDAYVEIGVPDERLEVNFFTKIFRWLGL